MPLVRALSKLGLASRAEAERLILAGRVRVHGKPCKDPKLSVNPETAHIEIDGDKAVQAEFRTFLLNKPKGLITTHSDERGRPTVFSLLASENLHLIAVGRLDAATTGLLLLTNDTTFSSWLTDPANQVDRTYLVTVRGEFNSARIEAILRDGVLDEGDVLKPSALTLRKASGRESHLVVHLAEGKNREIRRLFLALGHEVTRLHRVAYGELELGTVKPGEYRVIPEEELRRKFPAALFRGRNTTA